MFVHNAEIRVRYQETDMMGVVYHSNYLVWFEVGRTEYLRALGYSYKRLESEGIMLPVVECSCKFKSPAKYDDDIIIKASLQELSGASITIYYEIIKKETSQILVTGTTKHAVVDKNMRPIKIKTTLPEFWELLNDCM